MDWSRWSRHLFLTRHKAHALFSDETMERLQRVIAAGEQTHRGEVRLIVESALPLRKVRRGLTTRQRALDVFGTFRVWDTEENNGVLLYINIADRCFEVIADRAAARSIDAAVWRSVCELAQQAFVQGKFESGVTEALDAIHRNLAVAFSAHAGEVRRNEVGDEPIVL